jgi:SAM-dependent methyltransferase
MSDQSTPVPAEGYALAGTDTGRESRRFEATHRLYGPYSQVRLLADGLGPGAVCLEAGVGEGSMLRWLAAQVGLAGRVVGVDIDDRFFSRNEGPNVQLLCADIRTVEIAPRSIDYIHARNVLMFVPDVRSVLSRFRDWPRPGGAIVLSEIDFRYPVVASGVGEAYNRLCGAFVQRVADRGGDATLGTRLADLLAAVGFGDIGAAASFPILTPGDDATLLITLNVESLQQLLTEMPDPAETYQQLLADLPQAEVIQTCHTLVTTWGRRVS